MSHLEPPLCDDNFNFGNSKGMSSSPVNVAEYVDPQYTVKRYDPKQPEFMTPETSLIETTFRRESFVSSFCSSSAASSFLSHSGCGTPSLSTPGSSASNSRRQSMLLPESQQYYLSAISSSSPSGCQGTKKVAASGQCPLQEHTPVPYFADTNSAGSITGPGEDYTMDVDDLVRKTSTQWPDVGAQSVGLSLYGRTAQAALEEPTGWGYDLPIAARASATSQFSQPLYHHPQSTLIDSTFSQPDGDAYNTPSNTSPNVPSLEPPFEYDYLKCNSDVALAENDATNGRPSLRNIWERQILKDTPLSPFNDRLERDSAISRTVKSHKRHKKSRKNSISIEFFRLNRCREPECDYACDRQEHLVRHRRSKHMEAELLPCKFHGCIDRKTGRQREIKARVDNLTAHYTKTHFRYGNSEKGGKNNRKSMKAAYETGLSIYDNRWTLLLNDKMSVNREIKDNLHVWKMLGYSIFETRDIKVKDVKPENVKLERPTTEDATLQEFDPRWKALWDGTLTFDKAMNVGKDMGESEEQGLLGVTMLETEAMGIKHLDPRWTLMLSGRMSVEQSERLGVKQRNPVWKDLAVKRRAR